MIVQLSELKNIINNGHQFRTGSYDETVASFKDTQVLIYGAGAFGKQMLADLRSHAVPIQAFLDKNAYKINSIAGVPVYPPDEASFTLEYKKNCLVIISIVLNREKREQIKKYLLELGYQKIIDAQTIRAKRVPYNETDMEPNNEIIEKDAKDLLSALDLFADNHSREIYESCINCHLAREYENALESPNTIQYFVSNTPQNKGTSRFIDCGAYTGDTLKSLISRNTIQAYCGFEPGLESFKMLTQTADMLPETTLCVLFPCGVGRYPHSAYFNDIAGSGSISQSGTSFIQIVSLDGTLKNFYPTMIKMDIEGEEYNALQGAKKTITQSKPDLAICVYHRISDYWMIPLLIHSWNLGYKFYLRAHSSATMETVLYAVAP